MSLAVAEEHTEAETPRIKVSVVIASYNSGDGLYDLIASLDAQSLDRAEWEAIVVDDGSTDSTLRRLHALAQTRSYLRIASIPNSGWPCRPRNTGLDLARGEFVVFADHDDILYPRALERAYELAVSSGADVVSGREARTSQVSWAITKYERDSSDAFADESEFPLTRLNPHKLYRRSLLEAHGIRFRDEGRVLWEDKFFNLEVCKHTTRFATLASEPFYHWVDRGASTSTTFRRARSDWWHWLGEVLRSITELPAPEWDTHRTTLLLDEYLNNLIASFNAAYPKRPEAEQEMIFWRARALQDEFIPREFDDMLNPAAALRAKILRTGDIVALRELSAVDVPPTQKSALKGMRWETDKLHLDIETTWRAPAKHEGGLHAAGTRIVLRLPLSAQKYAETAEIDVTDAMLQTSHRLIVRGEQETILWQYPVTIVETTVGPEPDVIMSVRLRSTIDAGDNGFGKPLDEFDTVWRPYLCSNVLDVHRSRTLSTSDQLAFTVQAESSAIIAFASAKKLTLRTNANALIAEALRIETHTTQTLTHPHHHVVPVDASSIHLESSAQTKVFVAAADTSVAEDIAALPWRRRPAELVATGTAHALIVERRERNEHIIVALRDPREVLGQLRELPSTPQIRVLDQPPLKAEEVPGI